MKQLIKTSLFLLLGFGAFFVTGCEDNSFEDAADETGDAVENAGDNVQDAAN